MCNSGFVDGDCDWKLLQMAPSYHPEGLFRDGKRVVRKEIGAKPITQLWHMNGRCPQGTIPVRRTRKDDLFRASSIKSFGKKKHKTIPRPTSAAPEPDLINQNGHQVIGIHAFSVKFEFGFLKCGVLWKRAVAKRSIFASTVVTFLLGLLLLFKSFLKW